LLRLGLTGGVACGKSSVGQMLEKRGAYVIRADEIAHELMKPGQPVYEEIVKQFGREILQPSGEIDRAKLAQAAFGGGRVQQLNKIVHPAVIARQEQWMAAIEKQHPDAVAVVEAALILEAGVGRRFDNIMVVTCKPEQKAARFAARQKVTEEQARGEVERRSKAQLPDSEKIAAASYVIDNSGTPAETEAQIERIFPDLQKLAAGK
jgi:dephospho-CoA kinase